jgi:hypothetical protein
MVTLVMIGLEVGVGAYIGQKKAGTNSTPRNPTPYKTQPRDRASPSIYRPPKSPLRCLRSIPLQRASAMEEVTEAVNNMSISGGAEGHKKNRIQVSNTKKPLFFYVNLAKVRREINPTISYVVVESTLESLLCWVFFLGGGGV